MGNNTRDYYRSQQRRTFVIRHHLTYFCSLLHSLCFWSLAKKLRVRVVLLDVSVPITNYGYQNLLVMIKMTSYVPRFPSLDAVLDNEISRTWTTLQVTLSRMNSE